MPEFARQINPDPREGDPSPHGPDPFGETAGSTGCPGVLRRFPDRMLVMMSDRCFANCRHCTRRGLLGRAELVDSPERLAAACAYARANPSVRDVLLSGGDPLTLSDEAVLRFAAAFSGLPQVDVVRLCTRAPCVNPARVTPELCARLGALGKTWANVQFNCAGELTPEATAACRRLADAGIPVSCQTVLLKGVNDSADALLDLFRALQRAKVRPYYVFTCDPVAGVGHFRVSAARARELERECAARIGGLGLPRFVADVPGADRKIPVAELAETC